MTAPDTRITKAGPLIWAFGPLASVAIALVIAQWGAVPRILLTDRLLSIVVLVLAVFCIHGMIKSIVAVARRRGSPVIGMIGLACNGLMIVLFFIASGVGA